MCRRVTGRTLDRACGGGSQLPLLLQFDILIDEGSPCPRLALALSLRSCDDCCRGLLDNLVAMVRHPPQDRSHARARRAGENVPSHAQMPFVRGETGPLKLTPHAEASNSSSASDAHAHAHMSKASSKADRSQVAQWHAGYQHRLPSRGWRGYRLIMRHRGTAAPRRPGSGSPVARGCAHCPRRHCGVMAPTARFPSVPSPPERTSSAMRSLRACVPGLGCSVSD